MKAVLMSIQPRFCELIASGKKTVEVRKTKPKLEVPFKVYIYCTKSKDSTFFTEQVFEGEKGKWAIPYVGNGKVIGEFVCDRIVRFENDWYEPSFQETSDLSCVDFENLSLYLDGARYGYGWHISNLIIYDKPRELGEFEMVGCQGCRDKDAYHCKFHCFGRRRLKRPPQSWCYVERSEG